VAESELPPVRVGLIGCGRHASFCIHPSLPYLPQIAVVAVCDLDESRAKSTAGRLGVPAVYTQTGRMLAEQQPEAERAAPAPAAPSLSLQMSAYRGSIPADHVELEATPKTDRPNGPMDFKFQGRAIPQDLHGLTKKDFGYNQVIAHAPAAEVQNHLQSLPQAERPAIETGPAR